MNRYITSVVVGFVTAFALATPAAAGDGAYKLGGAWVARVQAEGGVFAGQWSYVVASDPSGRRASGFGSIDSGLNVDAIMPGVFEARDKTSPILVEIVMTGPRTATYYSIWYGLKDLGGTEQITHSISLIGVVTGELEFVAPGKVEGTHNFELYHPTQDGDGDGFPDPGETPLAAFPMYTLDTRLPLPE